MKRCRVCDEEKDLSAFEPQRRICARCRSDQKNSFSRQRTLIRRAERPKVPYAERVVDNWIHCFVRSDLQCQNYLIARGA